LKGKMVKVHFSGALGRSHSAKQ